MLILTRKIDEEIIIDSNIRIKILSSSDGQVKVGLTAPPEVEILRAEVYEKIKENTLMASVNSKNKLKGISVLKINKISK